jgi:hypothetical protein
MGFLERFIRVQPEPQAGQPAPPPAPAHEPGPEQASEPEHAGEPVRGREEADPREPEKIHVARTLVKSGPELAELVASDPRMRSDGCEVQLAEKGFGTRVAISAPAGGSLGREELEALLDELAEPQKRPFSNS